MLALEAGIWEERVGVGRGGVLFPKSCCGRRKMVVMRVEVGSACAGKEAEGVLLRLGSPLHQTHRYTQTHCRRHYCYQV
jgi:hypothetical protein